MLVEIDELGGVEAIPKLVERAKDKSDPFRLMGFGHRVYKVRAGRAEMYNASQRACLHRSMRSSTVARAGVACRLLVLVLLDVCEGLHQLPAAGQVGVACLPHLLQ
jgi:hypothetical protein